MTETGPVRERYLDILNSSPIISDQISRKSLSVVLRQLEKVLSSGVPGHVAEFGCYIGTTSLFLRRLLDAYDSSHSRILHVYDSFAGLPPKRPEDMSVVGDPFQAGELCVSRKQLFTAFHKAGLRTPVTHKGWFNELQDGDVPERLAFAFLDGDFYESILDSLALAWPRLSSGGRLCIDDYGREALPGVERAVHDYFARSGGSIPAVTVAHGIGRIIK